MFCKVPWFALEGSNVSCARRLKSQRSSKLRAQKIALLTGNAKQNQSMTFSTISSIGARRPQLPGRASTVLSGPDSAIGPLANRPRGTLVKLSVQLCWNLSSGLPHSFCRTWWKPRGAFHDPRILVEPLKPKAHQVILINAKHLLCCAVSPAAT